MMEMKHPPVTRIWETYKKNAWTVNWLSFEDDKPNLFISFSFSLILLVPKN